MSVIRSIHDSYIGRLPRIPISLFSISTGGEMKDGFLTFIYRTRANASGLDLTSLYLRTFFGAKAFASGELDSLAQRMGILERLSSNRQDRYFIVGAKSVTAANMGNKIVFGRGYYERLSEDQRLAVGAHEFAHSIGYHNERLKIASASLITSVLLTVGAYIGTGSVLVAELAFLGAFFCLMGVLSSRDARKNRNEELECDSLAVTFVGHEAMVSSIRLAEAMSKRRGRGGSTPWPSKSLIPTVEERANAIMAARTARTGPGRSSQPDATSERNVTP